jgi:DNA-binding Xre family transcriptional regulator
MEGDKMNTINQIELITLIEQWQTTDPTIYKTNIKAICSKNNVKPRHIKEGLNISDAMTRSILNVSHKARIEFITALKLAEYLKCDVKDFL